MVKTRLAYDVFKNHKKQNDCYQDGSETDFYKEQNDYYQDGNKIDFYQAETEARGKKPGRGAGELIE